MNDKQLMETAVLAGEIMLISGAEIFRVEDTINRILRKADRHTAETIVLSTGIFATLNDFDMEPITVVKRVTDRSTNLNKVYLVNDVSRKLCDDVISVEMAFERLQDISSEVQYRPWMKNVGIIGVSTFFSLLLGGNALDCFSAALVGSALAVLTYFLGRIRLNCFCQNVVSAFLAAVTALSIKQWVLPEIHRDIVIIGSIMTLVPGVIFTTAIRDILNGDYSSGTSRIMEAVVTALAVAAGVGAGMALFHQMTGGSVPW